MRALSAASADVHSEGEEKIWEEVTALEYARDFINPDLVNKDALRLVTTAFEAGDDSG